MFKRIGLVCAMILIFSSSIMPQQNTTFDKVAKLNGYTVWSRNSYVKWGDATHPLVIYAAPGSVWFGVIENADSLCGQDSSYYLIDSVHTSNDSGFIYQGGLVRGIFKIYKVDSADNAIVADTVLKKVASALLADTAIKVRDDSVAKAVYAYTGPWVNNTIDTIKTIAYGTGDTLAITENSKVGTAKIKISRVAYSDSTAKAGWAGSLQGKDTTALWNAKTLQTKDTTWIKELKAGTCILADTAIKVRDDSVLAAGRLGGLAATSYLRNTLDTTSAIAAGYFALSSGYPSLYAYGYANSVASVLNGEIWLGNNASYRARIYYDAYTVAGEHLIFVNTFNSVSKGFKFVTRAAATPDTPLVVLPTMVGIRTATPDSTLTVTGAGHFTTNLLVDGIATLGASSTITGQSNRELVILSADTTNSGAADILKNCGNLAFTVVSGTTYRFYALIAYTSAATTTGSRWTINAPAVTFLNYTSRYTIDAVNQTVNFCSAVQSPAASNASSLEAGNVARIEGVIKPSANGTVNIQFASEIINSAITAKAGSTLEWW